MKFTFARSLALTTLVVGVTAQKIVLTNDDGWAVAQLRDEYNMLTAAGYQVRVPWTISYTHFDDRYL